jgi:hypothetical protein
MPHHSSQVSRTALVDAVPWLVDAHDNGQGCPRREWRQSDMTHLQAVPRSRVAAQRRHRRRYRTPG